MGSLNACMLKHPLGKYYSQRLRQFAAENKGAPNAHLLAAEKVLAELQAERADIMRQVEEAKPDALAQPQPYGQEYAGEAADTQTEAATEARLAKRAAGGRRDPQVSKRTLEEGTDPVKSQAMLRVAERIGARETDVSPQRHTDKLRTGEQGPTKKERRLRGEKATLDEWDDGSSDTTFEATRDDGGSDGWFTVFRQGDQVEGNPIGDPEARDLINRFLAKAPKELRERVMYYYSPREIPLKYRRPMLKAHKDVMIHPFRGAVTDDGKILIIGQGHESLDDLEQTIAHEIAGHYGLRKLLGKRGLELLTERLMAQGNLGDIASALGVRDQMLAAYLDGKRSGQSDEQANVRAVDEMLAHVEERRPTEKLVEKAERLWKELAGLVRAIFRKLGLERAAKLNDADMMFLLARARRAAMKADGVIVDGNGMTVFRSAKPSYAPGYEKFAGVADSLLAKEKKLTDHIKSGVMGLSFRTRFLDAYAPIERLAEGMEDQLKATQMLYNLRMYNQRNHFVSEVMSSGPLTLAKKERRDGRTEFLVESKDGASFKDVIAALPKGVGNEEATKNLASLYAIGMRAKRLGWNRVNLSLAPEQKALADELVGDANSPFKAWHAKYQAFNKGLIDFAVETGAISKALGATLNKTQDYVPFYRQTSAGDIVLDVGSERSIVVGNIKQQPYLQELKGGDERILDFFAGSIRNAALLTDMAMRNLATRDVAFTLDAIGAGELTKRKAAGPNVINFKKDGDDMYFVADTKSLGVPTEILVQGLSGVPTSLPLIVKAMGVPANMLRRFVTRNPIYMARQLVRDPLSAWMTSGANFVPVANAVKEVGKSLAGTADQTLRKRGVVGGQVFSGDFHDLERVAKEMQAGQTGWATAMAKLDAAAIESDAATRRSVYNSLIDQGMSEMEATLASLESMNFNRRGVSASVRYANHLVPFLSATIQGWDVLWRAARGKMPFADRLDTRRKLLQRGMVLAGLSMLYALGMEDDEAYKNANAMERLSNWFVRIPGFDEPIKVPIPFELGLLFKALPEAMVMGMKDEDQIALKDMVLNTVPNVLVPHAVKPLVEAYLNRSFFSGRDIEGAGLQRLDIGQRADDRTTNTAKLLGFDVNLFGSQYGISPKKLEHLVSQYTGGMGMAAFAITDALLPNVGPAKPDRTPGEMPVLSGLFQRNNAGGDVNRLYKELEAIQRYRATYEKLLATDPAEAQEYARENPSKIAAGKSAAKAEAAIQKFTEAENNIRRSTMSPERKKQALDVIRERKAQAARQYRQMFAGV